MLPQPLLLTVPAVVQVVALVETSTWKSVAKWGWGIPTVTYPRDCACCRSTTSCHRNCPLPCTHVAGSPSVADASCDPGCSCAGLPSRNWATTGLWAAKLVGATPTG